MIPLLLLLADSLVVLFTGDLLLDRGVRPIAEKKGVEYLLEGVREETKRADAVVVNMECPLTDVATPLAKKYIFRADTRWAKDLKKAGVTHAALANNHTNDQGYQGIEQTVKSLRQAGIVTMGAGLTAEERIQPVLIEKNGIRVALFNAVLFSLENWTTPTHRWAPCQIDAKVMAQAIRSYRQQHPTDYIVAVLHWGLEFQKSPSLQQLLAARLLTSAGANAIVGHHPHVIQQPSYVDGKPVFYSLGNFVFDQHQPEARKAQLARLVFKGDSLSVTTLDIDIIQCRPILSRNNSHANSH